MPIVSEPFHLPRPLPPPAGLPHRSPFRLLDRLCHVDLAMGELWADKRVSAGDALWPGETPILSPVADAALAQPAGLPSLLLIEALSQAAACFNLLAATAAKPKTAQPAAANARAEESAEDAHLGFLVSVTDFRFPEELQAGASPGDTLLLHVKKQESLGALTAFFGQAFCLPALPAGGRDAAQSAAQSPPQSAASPSQESRFLLPPQARRLGHGRLLFAVTSK